MMPELMPELISELLASGDVAAIIHFFDVRVFNAFAESNQSPCPAVTTRVISIELMRSVFVRLNQAALHLLCSARGTCMGGLSQSLTDTLPPFLVLSGILRIR